jgi:hypothetical protein
MLDTSRVNSGTVRHLQEMEQGVTNLTSQVWNLLGETRCGFTFTDLEKYFAAAVCFFEAHSPPRFLSWVGK